MSNKCDDVLYIHPNDHNVGHSEVTCRICKKEFSVYNAELRKGGGKYCSRDCYYKSKIVKNDIRKCIRCETFFEVKPGRKKRYCSRNCATSVRTPEHCSHISQGRKGKYTGSQNPNWRGGKSFEPYCIKFNPTLKEKVRLKFDNRCYICGTNENNGKKLSVHHCDYNKSQGCSGFEWSLIPLCKKCHTRTNFKRWYWFCLLRDYWLNDYVNFNTFPPEF